MNLQEKRLFLLDMDGTIYLGNNIFNYTLNFLNAVTKIGAKYIFLTNNSSKSRSEYLKKLQSMQIPATETQLITSTHTTAKYLQTHHANKLIYAMGTTAFCNELESYNLKITRTLHPEIKVLATAYDPELTFKKLEDASILLTKGVEDYIATNPDLTCPTEFGYVPDCGSVAQMLKNATGKMPKFLGKPQPDMIYTALKQENIPPEKAVIIGDRQYTDIACGINAGIDTILVLSGETKTLNPAINKPTLTIQNVGELFR